jgi:saccharopine dehydrogenase-like NADP-dependent oxidoreductase
VKPILILGATGVFGQRLAKHIAIYFADNSQFELILTSRSKQKAEALVQEIRSCGTASAKLVSMAMDHRTGFVEALEQIKPWLVIDCSGPFQGADYSVAQAALRAGAHIVDLADARDFILGYYDALNVLACQKGLVALTGASSTPALSFAAVEALTKHWRRIDTIDIAITPGGQSPVGDALIGAILSYAGKPVLQWQEGQLQSTIGWASSKRMPIPSLGKRQVSPVETVDAEWLSDHFAVTSRVSFYAGLESSAEQWGMIVLANLRRLAILRDLQWLAPLLRKARALTRRTTGDQGGMVVRVKGLDARGNLALAEWSLLALKGDGPLVPTMPAAAIINALLAGKLESGARVATGATQLAAIEHEMTPYAISTRSVSSPLVKGGLFETALGSETYKSLSPAIRAFHDPDSFPVWKGLAEVGRGTNPVSRLVGWIFGLPAAGAVISVTVSVDREEGKIGTNTISHENWTRNFAGRRFVSHLASAGLEQATECFGPFTFSLGLVVKDKELFLPVKAWRLGFVPLPRFLAPRSVSREYQDSEGHFCFDVCLSLPFFGLLAHYRGWLKPGTN